MSVTLHVITIKCQTRKVTKFPPHAQTARSAHHYYGWVGGKLYKVGLGGMAFKGHVVVVGQLLFLRIAPHAYICQLIALHYRQHYLGSLTVR